MTCTNPLLNNTDYLPCKKITNKPPLSVRLSGWSHFFGPFELPFARFWINHLFLIARESTPSCHPLKGVGSLPCWKNLDCPLRYSSPLQVHIREPSSALLVRIPKKWRTPSTQPFHLIVLPNMPRTHRGTTSTFLVAKCWRASTGLGPQHRMYSRGNDHIFEIVLLPRSEF